MSELACVSGADIAWDESLERAYIAAVLEAGNPYFNYLFGDDATARGVLLTWAHRASSEIATHRSRVVLANSALAGGYVLLSAGDLKKARTADLVALLSPRTAIPRAVLQERLDAAQGLFPPVTAEDCYLSKIWVHPDYRGSGLGRMGLLPDVLQRARELGRKQIQLDVFAGNQRAYNMYVAAGYTELGRHTAACGFEYVRMARPVES